MGKWVKPRDLTGIDLRLRYVVLLLLFTGMIPASAFVYEMTWSYENNGVAVYNMSQKDLGVPVFPDTTYQTVTMETSFEGEWVELEPGFLKMVPFSPVLVPIQGCRVEHHKPRLHNGRDQST